MSRDLVVIVVVITLFPPTRRTGSNLDEFL